MKQKYKLVNEDSKETILPHLKVAQNPWQRFVGLMFRKNLPEGFGLWIIPCKSIHTMWMRISIDVYFLDIDGKIIDVRKNIKPWRIVFAKKGTHSVLETVAGSLAIEVGTIVKKKEIDRTD